MTELIEPQLPAEFLERLHKLLANESPEVVDQVLASMQQRRPSTFRINTLKATAEEIIPELEANGFTVQAISWMPNAFQLTTGMQRDLTALPLYAAGKIYLQSLSSMIPPIVLDPQSGEHILDLTAAPGSKTTQMAAMMKNQGQIVANDASPVRIYKLRANLEGQGATNVRVMRGAGEQLWRRFPEVFDRTLVDVPCSMEGRFCLAEPTSFEDWSYRKVRDLSIRQMHLLRGAVSATKVGGVIVYSTCTMSPEENEHVVQWLLNKEAGNVVVEEIQSSPLLQLAEARPGMAGWERETFSPELQMALRILPSDRTEGFFVVKLRKVATTLHPEVPRQSHFSRHKPHWRR